MLQIKELEASNKLIEDLQKEGLVINTETAYDYEKRVNTYKHMEVSKRFWNDMRVLITGISGFAGSHLAERLLELDANVFGIVRRHAVPEHKNLEGFQDELHLYEGDITSRLRVEEIFEKVQPNIIFHLAAESFVPTSFNEPQRVANTNIGGTVNIFDSLDVIDDLLAIQVACSSEQYGKVYPTEVPITETQEFRPRSIYGITKVATEYIAKLYAYMRNVPAIITRAFNHEGPRRGLQFFTSVIHKQVAEIVNGKRESIVMGNPNAIRDFTHVKDTIRAYLLAVEMGDIAKPYNICSGVGIKVGDYAKLACELFNIDSKIYVDEERLRPSEVPLLIGNHDRITSHCEWQPKYSLYDIIVDGVESFL